MTLINQEPACRPTSAIARGCARVAPRDGHEFRGVRIRLYPTAEQVAQIEVWQEQLRRVWNWLVGQRETALEASRAFAVRAGLVGARPVMPDFNGLSPDESERAAQDHRRACFEWAVGADRAAKHELGTARFAPTIKEWCEHLGVRHDYQLFQIVIGWHSDATHPWSGVLQALAKDFLGKSKRRKTFKRAQDHVPFRTRSKMCFLRGDFGSRGNNPAFYDCQVSISGLRIRGRCKGSGLDPSWRVLEGVSVSREADGWWASIKVERPVRQRSACEPGTTIGIDVGLRTMVAFSDGHTIANPRDRAYSDAIAARQSELSSLPRERQYRKRNQIARLQQRQARHVRHVIYSEVVPHVERAEVIAVEQLPPNIGQRGSRMTSVMRTVTATLKARCGDRVREVRAAFTSQTCSRCGERDKEAWAYGDSPVCVCPHCGHREHRDVNAARNVAARAA